MRNSISRLASVPTVNKPRSKIRMSPFRHLTTMNSGYLVPIFYQNCIPGGNYRCSMRQLIRMSTPIHPVMDDCYIDTYFFLVPYRLVWENWEEFMGENKKSYWTKDQTQYTVPMLQTGLRSFEVGSIADHFGHPTGVAGLKVSALPFRGTARVWNEWFRDENTMAPVEIPYNSASTSYSEIANGYFIGGVKGGALFPVSKFKDYFTSALPSPQRGPDVMLPLYDGLAPVVTQNDPHINSSQTPMQFVSVGGLNFGSGYNDLSAYSSGGIRGSLVANTEATAVGESDIPVAPSNLYANLSDSVTATVNQLRIAVALQTFYEAAARYGSRYTESLRAHFGVASPDARLQRTEYLGGKRTKINMQQVLQTSSTDDISPQGNTAAFSLTADIVEAFDVSVVEHAMILGFACIRTAQTYQYGIERSWSYKDPTDFYFPEFANIGEQPVYNKEIYAQGNAQDDEVFGYQEAWAEYRQQHSKVSGMFRSSYAQSLDSWHYAEAYDSLPTLSESFIKQSPDVIDRSLAVQSETADQFLCDFRFEETMVAPIPMYSIPGFGMNF